MISESVALSRLSKELRTIKFRELRTEYILGVIRGLEIAKLIIQTLCEETRLQFHRNPKRTVTGIATYLKRVKREVSYGH